MQCLITVYGNIFLDVFGINNTAVSQSDSELLLIEVGFGQGNDCIVVNNGFLIQKITTDNAVSEVFLNNTLYAFRVDLGIEITLGINDHDRAERTQTEAAGAYNENLVFKTILFQGLIQCFQNLLAAGRSTAGTAANQHLLTVTGMGCHFFALFFDDLTNHYQFFMFFFDLIEFF